MRLHQRQGDGHTLREHLQAAAAVTGQLDPELILPPVPRGCSQLVEFWGSLSDARQASMGAALPVLPTEIEALQRLYGLELTPWEVETVRLMDRAGVLAMNPPKKAGGKAGTQQ